MTRLEDSGLLVGFVIAWISDCHVELQQRNKQNRNEGLLKG